MQNNFIKNTATMAKQLMRVPRVRKVQSSTPWLAKSYSALQTVHHCFNICSSGCVALVLRYRAEYLKLITYFGIKRRV